MEFTCRGCGLVNELPGTTDNILNWQEALDPKLVAALEFGGYWPNGGDTGSGAWREYVTLFVSTIFRYSLRELVESGNELALVQVKAKQVYQEIIAPVLKKVSENFKVVGSVVQPSVMKLAQVDLSSPYAILCFPVIKFEPGYQEKLNSLGLGRLTREGAVDTVSGQRWPGDADEPRASV